MPVLDVIITITMGGTVAGVPTRGGHARLRVAVSKSTASSTSTASTADPTPFCITDVALPELPRLLLADHRTKIFTPHCFGHEGDMSEICDGGDCSQTITGSNYFEGEPGMMPNGNERSMQWSASAHAYPCTPLPLSSPLSSEVAELCGL